MVCLLVPSWLESQKLVKKDVLEMDCRMKEEISEGKLKRQHCFIEGQMEILVDW